MAATDSPKAHPDILANQSQLDVLIQEAEQALLLRELLKKIPLEAVIDLLMKLQAVEAPLSTQNIPELSEDQLKEVLSALATALEDSFPLQAALLSAVIKQLNFLAQESILAATHSDYFIN